MVVWVTLQDYAASRILVFELIPLEILAFLLLVLANSFAEKFAQIMLF